MDNFFFPLNFIVKAYINGILRNELCWVVMITP